MSIYTKTGDEGYTSLCNEGRYNKSDPVFDILGTIDELNSCLGFLHIYKNNEIIKLIKNIQRDLFVLGSQISGNDVEIVWESKVIFLEENIDLYDARLEKLTNFILPGGSIFSSYLNLSRAVCRRLERYLNRYGSRGPYVIYINRLSDLLFVLGRYVNKIEEIPDVVWKSDNI